MDARRSSDTVDHRAAGALLRQVAACRSVTARLAQLSRLLLGRPYVDRPLGGGPDQPEELVTRLDGFDCVTLVESALALARVRRAAAFAAELRRLRYRDGRLAWSHRLHYFSDWLRTNQAQGVVRIRTRGTGSRAISARLSAVAGLPPRRVRFDALPKRALHRARRRVAAANVVAFASTRSGLDFFHTGLLLVDPAQPEPERWELIHASRSAGRVLAEPLQDFLHRNRMRGLAWASPAAWTEKEASPCPPSPPQSA